ncbi:MAG: PDZ domain-containing protein [Spirochaetales bacterium]|nr:PDZ domain-containing protein [Leptospiraceae bacterium]MCP5483515.1 PDZ domain-containing protein [Spirochaetales bacterium]MCP5486733.1 PDZ domain-containing protein [Spirochaetales bacterium]
MNHLRHRLAPLLLAGILCSAACRGAATAETPLAAINGPAYLGVLYFDSGRGAFIVTVLPDSPAERAGVEQGDTILRVNGQYIGDGPALRRQIDRLRPGDRMEIMGRRANGREYTLHAVLEPRPPDTDFEERRLMGSRP